MKTPDVLLGMPIDEFETIQKYYEMEQTEKQLKDALYATRQERSGISLDVVAQTMIAVFDSMELEALINTLQSNEN